MGTSNASKNRAVQHVRMRSPDGRSIVLAGKRVVPDLGAVIERHRSQGNAR